MAQQGVSGRGGDFALRVIYERDFQMNTNLSKLVGVIGALVMAGGAMAQSNQTASSAASAIVIAPLTIAKTGDLNFGNVVAGAALGTVVLLPAGTRSATGGTTFSAGFPGTLSAAKFDLTGEGVYTYAITLPGTVTLSDTVSTPNTMTATGFTVAAGTTGSVSGLIGTLAGGLGKLNVGATLNVGAAQVPGTYTGSFDVTVAYN